MDGAPSDEIIRVVKKCPTQALTFAYNKDLEQEKQVDKTPEDTLEEIPELRIMGNGPIVLHGNFHLTDADGKELRQMKIQSLCRCGASMAMPYCDGTHRKIGFTDK